MGMVSTLTRWFPPPRYISMPSIGVDISDTSLKYVQCVPDRGVESNLALLQYGEVDLEAGVLERGRVLNEASLTSVLRDIKKATGVGFFHVSLPEERAYLFETEVKKGTPFKEIRGLLEFRLEENVPLTPQDAYFDYDIVEDMVDQSMLRISVTAYARETIEAYFNVCRNAGVVPLSFQVEAQAIARSTIPAGDPRTYLIVDFGKTRTGVGIMHHGSLMYTSTIDIGGINLSNAMRKQLGSRDEHELTKLKNTEGLIPHKEHKEVYEAIISPVSAIASELSTRIQYWNTRDVRHIDQSVERVILCGGSANLRGLPGYLREILGVEAELANVWQHILSLETQVPEIPRRLSYGYATAVGLALTDYMTL